MDRLRRHEDSRSPPVIRPDRTAWRRLVPTWMLSRGHGKRWTRFHIFNWSQLPGETPFDNSVPDRLARAIMRLSRLMGPVLMLAGCAAVFWGLIGWLA